MIPVGLKNSGKILKVQVFFIILQDIVSVRLVFLSNKNRGKLYNFAIAQSLAEYLEEDENYSKIHAGIHGYNLGKLFYIYGSK